MLFPDGRPSAHVHPPGRLQLSAFSSQQKSGPWFETGTKIVGISYARFFKLLRAAFEAYAQAD